MTKLLNILLICLCLVSCKTVKVVEKINYRDSVVVQYHHDTTHITIADTTHIEQHVVVTDSSALVINFGNGGGTYNAHTGMATNVASVQQIETHKEQRDSIADLKQQLELAQATNDSLNAKVSAYEKEYSKDEQVKRSGYARFTSWWFWVTLILILIKVAAWVMEKIPVTAPYIILIRKFIPFL